MAHPKFILVSSPDTPRIGRFVYGMVGQHKELAELAREYMGYVRIHGGGWYDKDDESKTMTLYGSSGDYGEPRLAFLNQIPRELRDYKFIFSPGWNLPGNELDLRDAEWI